MKKFYLLFFSVIFISLNAQIVNIPDANFKAALINANPDNNTAYGQTGGAIVIDTNGDGEIQISEALTIYRLQLTIFNISDMTGIEAFSNLEFLDCSNNDSLYSLDLSGNLNLTKLNCDNNHLTELNISQNTLLEELNCSENNLINIDLSNNPNLNYLLIAFNDLVQIDLSNNPLLESFNCWDNNLSELDLSENHLIESVNCSYNNLSEIDISSNPNLTSLNCRYNNLSQLDLSGAPLLNSLNCKYNNLAELDFSANSELVFLDCEGNWLTSLDFSNNPNISELIFQDYNILYDYNPLSYISIKNGNDLLSLYGLIDIPENCYVCVDEADIGSYDLDQLPEGVVVSTYCSYPPGGIYNTIFGEIKYDIDNDGFCDIDIDNFQLNISDGNETGHTFANNEGEYTFYVPEGNFTLTPEIIENPDYFIISPANANLNFPLLDGSTQTQNFCISPNGNHPDVEIIFSQLVPARPGFEASYRLVYRNKGNQTVSGTISLEYDEDKLDFLNSTVTPDNQSSGLLNYNFSNLNPFEIRTIELSFEVNAPTDTPPVNIGDNLPFSAQIDIGEDENPNDNSFELNQEVVGSFDPNDIACLQGESVAPEMIGEELHYRIRFENTGNFPAERVVVAMPINPEDYEVSSFQLLNTSHEVQARVVDNTAEFFFEEIDLGPNEEGDILFSIKSLESLQIGDSVMSYADIYFDYNYPITTNEAVTTFEIMRTKEVELSSVSIFPNPATTQFMIQSDYKINSVEIYDVAGRLIQVSKLNSNQSSQNISQLPKGMYILKIQTEKGLVSYKLIKK